MTTRRKKGDSRNLIIGILSLVVVVETLLLVYPLKEKFPSNLTKRGVKDSRLAAVKPGPAAPEVQTQKIIPPKIPTEKTVALPPTVSPKESLGKIAFVLDDWGYQQSSCRDLKTIDVPLAVAILPKLEHSKSIAQCAHDNQKVVMLHLPLEPHKYLEKYPDNYYIKTGMTDRRIIRMLEEDLRDIPYVEGVNNHTGSKATEDRRVMSVIFGRLKEKNLFFVDSFVTSESVCKTVARAFNLEFARRDIFLDNEDSRAYIEGQFKDLAKEARTKGYAIAIGHDRPLTLKILHEQIPVLQKQGFKIVSIRDLLKAN